jgi:hypothetical protein
MGFLKLINYFNLFALNLAENSKGGVLGPPSWTACLGGIIGAEPLIVRGYRTVRN